MIRAIMKVLASVVILALVFGRFQTAFGHESGGLKGPSRQSTTAPQISRTAVIKAELEGMPGKQMLAWVARIPPGGTSGWHYHPYDEFVYILDGAVTMQVKGKAPVIVRAGETFHVPANAVHRATNASNNPAKGLVFGLTSKGEPLAFPAKK